MEISWRRNKQSIELEIMEEAREFLEEKMKELAVAYNGKNLNIFIEHTMIEGKKVWRIAIYAGEDGDPTKNLAGTLEGFKNEKDADDASDQIMTMLTKAGGRRSRLH